MQGAFAALPRQKQEDILLAAMEVFAKNEYKRASTDVIAVKAGVSKGMLFYYFHNKRAIYEAVYEYALRLNARYAAIEEVESCTDFFELLQLGARAKISMMERYPFLIDFSMRAYYSQNEEISPTLDVKNARLMDDAWGRYFSSINVEKFKTDVNPHKVLQMLVWMADGYLNEQRRTGKRLDVEAMIGEFDIWCTMMRKVVYKEEFQ